MRALYLLGSTMRKLALLLFCLAPSLVLAQGLDDVKFSALPGDRFEVRLTFDGAPPEPQGYTIERPARIVLDFPDVVSNLNQRRFPLSFENSSSAMRSEERRVGKERRQQLRAEAGRVVSN